MVIPFPDTEYEARIRNCQDWMKTEGYEAILAYSMGRWSMMAGRECGGNGIYYVGFNYAPADLREKGGLLTPFIKTHNVIFIPKTGDPAWLFPGNEGTVETLHSQVWMKDIRAVGKTSFAAHVQQLVEEKGLDSKGKIGLGGKQTPIEILLELQQRLPHASYESVTPKLALLRQVKSGNELEVLRKCFEINDSGLYAMIETCKPGVAEWEVHQAMESAMFKSGAHNMWSIAHSGPRTYNRAGPDFTQRIVQDGDIVDCDYGNEYFGYHSDTNYAMIVGKAKEHQKEIIELTVRMQDAMIAVTKHGVTDAEVFGAAMKVAETSPYKKYVGSFFGHAYGCGGELLVLNPSTLLKPKDQRTVIKENMFMCYEPNVRMPGVGGVNLEDGLVVTKDGCEVITHNSYEARKAIGMA